MIESVGRGRVVRSAAGHDKDRFYVVVTRQADRVFIADGKLRKLAKPKAKNIRHVRATGILIDMEDCKTDKKLRTLLAPLNSALKAGTDAIADEGDSAAVPWERRGR